jgi:hypothetical protein
MSLTLGESSGCTMLPTDTLPRGHDSAATSTQVTGGEVQRKGTSAAASLTLGDSSGCTMLPTGTLPSHFGRPGGPNCMVGSKTAAAMVTPSRDQVISFGGIKESAAVRLEWTASCSAKRRCYTARTCDDDRSTSR